MESGFSPQMRCPGSVRRSGYNHKKITMRMESKQLVSDRRAPGSLPSDYKPSISRMFLLSPANTSAIRGQLLLNPHSKLELAQRIRRQGAPLGEIFSFISSLYFRGKIAYAKAFGNSPPGVPPMLTLTQ